MHRSTRSNWITESPKQLPRMNNILTKPAKQLGMMQRGRRKKQNNAETKQKANGHYHHQLLLVDRILEFLILEVRPWTRASALPTNEVDWAMIHDVQSHLHAIALRAWKENRKVDPKQSQNCWSIDAQIHIHQIEEQQIQQRTLRKQQESKATEMKWRDKAWVSYSILHHDHENQERSKHQNPFQSCLLWLAQLLVISKESLIQTLFLFLFLACVFFLSFSFKSNFMKRLPFAVLFFICLFSLSVAWLKLKSKSSNAYRWQFQSIDIKRRLLAHLLRALVWFFSFSRSSFHSLILFLLFSFVLRCPHCKRLLILVVFICLHGAGLDSFSFVFFHSLCRVSSCRE